MAVGDLVTSNTKKKNKLWACLSISGCIINTDQRALVCTFEAYLKKRRYKVIIHSSVLPPVGGRTDLLTSMSTGYTWFYILLQTFFCQKFYYRF